MSIKYVSQEEIKVHKAALQQVVEDEKKEQDAISESKRKVYNDSSKKMRRLVTAAEDKMRKAIETAQKAADQTIEAAKKESDEIMKAAEALAEQKKLQAETFKERKLAAMRRDFERLPLLRQIYNEAPDDVFELIVSKSSAWVGLNNFRLANKRCKQVVDSCARKLDNQRREDGPDSLPEFITRCRRVEMIVCQSRNLRSLEGCPRGLKQLWIRSAVHLSDLSPLASCSMMENLMLISSSITDISVLSSMPLLEVFASQKIYDPGLMSFHGGSMGGPSIKDLTPLSSCPRLKQLYICDNSNLVDLSPLSACTTLQILSISNCPLITSLAPLSTLINLEELHCYGADSKASVLPLMSCSVLKFLSCNERAADLEELRRRRPHLIVQPLFN